MNNYTCKSNFGRETGKSKLVIGFALFLFLTVTAFKKDDMAYNGALLYDCQLQISSNNEAFVVNNKLDTIQKEYLITRSTTYDELQAIQRSLSENNYQFHIENFETSNKTLIKIAGYIKHKDAATNNNSFQITNVKTLKITINKDNKKGKIEIEHTNYKPNKEIFIL